MEKYIFAALVVPKSRFDPVCHSIEGIAEHLIMCFLAIEQEVDGFAYLLILDLAVEMLINHLGSLLGRDIGEQIGAQVASTKRHSKPALLSL
jgi:hypothetical protein